MSDVWSEVNFWIKLSDSEQIRRMVEKWTGMK